VPSKVVRALFYDLSKLSQLPSKEELSSVSKGAARP
jgi:hypothetical protein